MISIKKFLIGFSSLFAAMAVAAGTTKSGIPLDTPWKQKVYDFALENVKHSAWGIDHSERDYQVGIILGEEEGIRVDKDVLFAAAFLHDIGAIEPYRKKEIEHSLRSVEIVEPLLQSWGFPMEKWPSVKAAILGHMYYADRPTDSSAMVLHDADALDFFGAVGIMRLASITGRHAWAPSLPGAVETLKKFKNEVPDTLVTNTARKIAAQRIAEMEQFFILLNQETLNGKAV